MHCKWCGDSFMRLTDGECKACREYRIKRENEAIERKRAQWERYQSGADHDHE